MMTCSHMLITMHHSGLDILVQGLTTKSICVMPLTPSTAQTNSLLFQVLTNQLLMIKLIKCWEPRQQCWMLLVLFNTTMVSLVLESSIQLTIMFQEFLRELMRQIQFTQMLLIELHRLQDLKVPTGSGATGRMEHGLTAQFLISQTQQSTQLWSLQPITHLTLPCKQLSWKYPMVTTQ